MTGQNQLIAMSFMLVGHTKFSPDWCFGLLKRLYKRTFVSCLKDIADVVDSSADVNVSQLMGTQSGETVVPTYDWSTFLSVHFRKIPQLKSFHHFMFSAQHPGTVSLKNYSDSEETTFHMLSDDDWYTTISGLPSVIPPSGLPSTRQWYLYQQIREYCRAGTEDLTCPRPNVDHGPLPTPDMPDDDGPGDTPPPKRARRCGKCGHTGHTRRTCKED